MSAPQESMVAFFFHHASVAGLRDCSVRPLQQRLPRLLKRMLYLRKGKCSSCAGIRRLQRTQKCHQLDGKPLRHLKTRLKAVPNLLSWSIPTSE